MPIIAEVSREVTQDFDEIREKEINKDKSIQKVADLQRVGKDWKDAQLFYETWNGDDFDRDVLAIGYKGALWIKDYVLHLNFNKNIRILDACCGTGLVARYLQQHGYKNIDGLDSSEAMMEKAKKLNLYQEYHCCPIGYGHEIPIRDGQYELLTVAGGFGEEQLYPDTFDELLRLIKVGGYLINATREEVRRDIFPDTFDAKCRQLEADGKWELVYDHVNPYYQLKIPGLVQVYRKKGDDSGEKVLEAVKKGDEDGEMTPKEAYENIMKSQSEGITFRQSQEIYLGWNGKTYEANKMAAGYRGADWAAEYLAAMVLDKEARILDVCAGTGLVAKRLKEMGYTNIDALDSSKEMIKGSVDRGYKHFHILTIGCDDVVTNVGAATYDAVVVAGGFAEGHLLPSALRTLVRLVRPGGFVVNAMRERDRRDVAVFRGAFDRTCRRLAQEGCWEILYEHVNPGYILDERGLVQVFRVKKRAHLESGCWTGNAEEEED